MIVSNPTLSQTSFRVKVCDQTVPAGPPGGAQHRLEGLSIEWSDGPYRTEVEEAVDFFRGVEPAGTSGRIDHLRRRQSLLATPTGHVVLVHYRVGYLLFHRRLSATYRRHLRTLAAALREHGRRLSIEHEHLRASTDANAGVTFNRWAVQEMDGVPIQQSDPGADPTQRPPTRALTGAQLTAAEAHLLRLPETTWTPWGIHHGSDADVLELLASHISPAAASALADAPASLQVALLL